MYIETITHKHSSTSIRGFDTICMVLVGFCLTIAGLDSAA